MVEHTHVFDYDYKDVFNKAPGSGISKQGLDKLCVSQHVKERFGFGQDGQGKLKMRPEFSRAQVEAACVEARDTAKAALGKCDESQRLDPIQRLPMPEVQGKRELEGPGRSESSEMCDEPAALQEPETLKKLVKHEKPEERERFDCDV